jgi:hypothetical protein
LAGRIIMECSKEAFIVRGAHVLKWTVVFWQKMITSRGGHRRIEEPCLFDEVYEVLFRIT